MKILFIIPYVPSLVRVRPFQIIRHLKARGHHITLATISTNQQEETDLIHFREYCDEVISVNLSTYRSLLNCILALPTKLPLQSVYSWDNNLFSLIKDHIWKDGIKPTFDIIHIEHLRGSQYGVHLVKMNNHDPDCFLPPIVWDSVDCISYLFKQAAQQSQQGLKRRITQFDLHRTERQEGWLTSRFDHVLVTSEKDKKALLELTTQKTAKIEVLPNGVDLEYFRSADDSKREESTLVISGKMSYHANVNMVLFLVQEVMSLVWKSYPNVKLIIVGKDPTPEIMDLGKLPAITVTGTVKSILPFLQTATIAVAPIQYGAGIQNKVLEAMACATPVIASSLATSALDVESGKELIIADSPEEWAFSILDLIGSPENQNLIGQAGRQYVEKNHRWSEIARQLETTYIRLINPTNTLKNRFFHDTQ